MTQRPSKPTTSTPASIAVQLLFPLSAAIHDGILKIELVCDTGLELSAAAVEALANEGIPKPTDVGGLSQGKYPVSTGPSGVDVVIP